jgi:hypothetical protein
MRFALQTLLVAAALSAYLALAFYVLPRFLLIPFLARRFAEPEGGMDPHAGAGPVKAAARVKALRILIPCLFTLALLLLLYGTGMAPGWLERYIDEADSGREWVLFLLLGEVMALAAFLGSRLDRVERERLGKPPRP